MYGFVAIIAFTVYCCGLRCLFIATMTLPWLMRGSASFRGDIELVLWTCACYL